MTAYCSSNLIKNNNILLTFQLKYHFSFSHYFFLKLNFSLFFFGSSDSLSIPLLCSLSLVVLFWFRDGHCLIVLVLRCISSHFVSLSLSQIFHLSRSATVGMWFVRWVGDLWCLWVGLWVLWVVEEVVAYGELWWRLWVLWVVVDVVNCGGFGLWWRLWLVLWVLWVWVWVDQGWVVESSLGCGWVSAALGGSVGFGYKLIGVSLGCVWVDWFSSWLY